MLASASRCPAASSSPPSVRMHRWADAVLLARVQDAEPLRLAAPMDAETALRADVLGASTGRPRVRVDARAQIRILLRRAQREPAVGVLADPAQHGLGGHGRRADPHRDGALDGQRVDPHLAQPIELALEGDLFLRPQPLEQRHLLAASPAARLEVLAQRLELAAASPDADAEPKAPAAQDVDLGRLLRHQRGLSRRQHQHRRHQLDRAGAPGNPGEQGQRLVQVSRVLANDLLGDPQVGEAQRLGARRELANRAEVVAKLAHRERDTDPHGLRSITGLGSSWVSSTDRSHRRCASSGSRLCGFGLARSGGPDISKRPLGP